MADKLTHQLVDALSRAAADPAGVSLFASKADPGLFPTTPAGKAAAQKCLADGLVRAAGTNAKAYTLTDAGWAFLLAAADPKQVLEDFVRVLEARQGEVAELLAVARRTADHLHGLREAVARVLPKVSAVRVPAPELPAADPGAALVGRLREWAATAPAGQDCPLPDLYRRAGAASIGAFHDALRALHDRGDVYLHPWTGPLYALPEPAFALLVGHGIAYYASLRREAAPAFRADRLAAVVG